MRKNLINRFQSKEIKYIFEWYILEIIKPEPMPNALDFQSEANINRDFVCPRLKLEMKIQKAIIRRKKFLSGIV